MRILKIKPEHKPERADIPDTLEAMQKVVDGYIQAVYPFEEPVALICNEEGKLNGLPLNRALWDEDGNPLRRSAECREFPKLERGTAALLRGTLPLPGDVSKGQ